jgi:hypothetical protein
MRMLPSIAAIGLCSLLIPATSSAQSLADAAAKEKERRKGMTRGKTYTEDDLRRAGADPRAVAAASADSASTASAPAEGADASADKGEKGETAGAAKGQKPKTDDEVRAEREKDWHDRMAKANAEVDRLKADIAVLETTLGDLSQNLYSSTRSAQMGRLEDDKKQLAAAEQKVAELQEEGRRNSYR